MTIEADRCSHTILQKSSKAGGTGPVGTNNVGKKIVQSQGHGKHGRGGGGRDQIIHPTSEKAHSCKKRINNNILKFFLMSGLDFASNFERKICLCTSLDYRV